MTARAPEEIHALLEAAFKARDLDAYIDLYDEDAALIVPPEGERVSGKEAIRASVEATFALEPDFRSEVVEKLEGASIALTHARWSLAGTGEDGSPVEMSGRATMVSRRQPNGSWRIVLDNPMTP
ncbi:MAG: YybH family protein [Microbacterium sp.]|uniref:YybH family protein n=1 Tax=Microbacterium sp. TaxID=51671 RepID=UPI003D6DA88F